MLTASRLFEHFHDLRSRTQAARYRVLQLLNELMQTHRKGETAAARDVYHANIQKPFVRWATSR